MNLTEETVKPLITSRTRAVICQHTFGIPADAKALSAMCNTHNLILIEDCAHVMPDSVGPTEIGKYGDACFFSFGRDKAISGITGGAVVSKLKIENYNLKIADLEQQAADLSAHTIFRLLLYPCLYVAARPLYGLYIGKVLLWMASKLGVLLPYVTTQEKKGHMSPLLHTLPNSCAALALTQFRKLRTINEHRRQRTHQYLEQAKKNNWEYPKNISPDLPLQKFPIFIANADEMRLALKKQNIHLEDGWTGAVVCPRSTDQQTANYREGSCPVAQKVASKILNLPTHPGVTEKMARTLIGLLSNYQSI